MNINIDMMKVFINYFPHNNYDQIIVKLNGDKTRLKSAKKQIHKESNS